MAQKIHKVVIGGLEYKLTSDDESTLRNAVELVNSGLDELNKLSDVKLPITQLYVLVALNLAERLSKLEKSIISEREFFKAEINTLTELIDKAVS